MAGNPFAKSGGNKSPFTFGRIQRRGGKWVALAADKKTVIGSHPTFRDAVKQIQSDDKKKSK